MIRYMMITQNRLDQIMMYFTKCIFEVKKGYHDRTLFSSNFSGRYQFIVN